MSDVGFDFSDPDLNDVSSSLVNPDMNVLSAGTAGIPASFLTSTPALVSASGSPILTMPQSLSAAGGSVLDSITKLVTGVYQGEAQIATAQGNVKVAQANAQAKTAVAQATPTLLIVGGAGLLLLVLLEAGKK